MTATLAPGTYRTAAGKLVHCRLAADGALRCADEEGEAARAGEGMVMLSDDPSWPDNSRLPDDPLLFAD